ncbi:hypothetical protein M3079_00690 [Phascolarctobacterium sp. ET69]|uniref:autotransporter outer membrane beta-barrel domain-containing protein n=1 Tax=Phascolarctobacterium sp. ET69 TaxID=2939420 RepID=UPI002012E647|nr:autotransporter outer membrane beta-barrel domain-containing protein [Phascolarctobacterium sp. ET69]MCL1604509.1 hypothetical protein [Phascolarctobacterium sp. ET69]
MGKNLQYKILLSLLAAGSISVYGFVNTAAAEDLIGNGSVTINSGDVYDNVYGQPENNSGEPINNASVTMTGGTINGSIYGAEGTLAETNLLGTTVTISGDSVFNSVYGAQNYNANIISGTTVEIIGNAKANSGSIYGARGNNKLENNKVLIGENANVNFVYGVYVNSPAGSGLNNYVEISGNAVVNGDIYGVFGGNSSENTVVVKDNANVQDVYGGYNYAANTTIDTLKNNHIYIIGGTANNVVGGWTMNGHSIEGSTIYISSAKINDDVYGAYHYIDSVQNDRSFSNNIITLGIGADVSESNLFGYYIDGTPSNDFNIKTEGNKLIIDNWNGSVKGVYNFSDINFDNITWDSDGTVLNIINNTEDSALADTNINLNKLNFEGGAELTTGDSMTFINGEKLGIDSGKVIVADEFTAGVATVGTGAVEVADNGNSVKYTLTEVKQNNQVNLVAENRAVAAAFINQGTDLISDSLDTISRDSNYGVKTFAAVHGNRSKYDVNSDIKINGWSTIVGVGNADKFGNGSEFSWGVFYENGSGNYRTFNEFNNEFFRGDGSLVYNGGGIAARYTNKNGVYTEGSLRAGMLKSDMDNALRDGAGNFYGYESESAYYGAHIGVGKIISLSESSDLDIYGKFFHTYTEGDSFKVANDEFEFDSINSDRLRIGARITSNKESKFTTYYGLAYEYEFNGDADMTAQGLKAPTQSLQGSSVMAEVGFNYQPTPDSPWTLELNMRGYAGERQGGSFNVQATYTF